jgi:putative peptide zinc metalloprotease protein
MNLTEALNAALPEIITRRSPATAPRLDPAIVGREHEEEGSTVIVAHRPGTSSMFHFTPQQWQALQLFDGDRSYREIGDACEGALGVRLAEEDVKEFAASLDTLDVWYRTSQEKNLALMEKLVEERTKRVKRKSKYGDVSHIQFSAWDPDRFMDRMYPSIKWLYSGWFTFITLLSFVFMFYIFFDRWSEIGPDTLQYYTFTDKTLSDLAEFWILFLILGFFHESAHALTCKHYGGGVHKMGFHLIFLTPAFFVDVTEAWVYANRWQRLVTIIAGIWVELIFCAAATFVWWGTAPGSSIHEFAYKIMLITGVAVILVNLNPLIKLDGYYFFTELIDVREIKERSTAYVGNWVKKHIWRLPVEVEFVPRRLRWLFVPYAILSGIYSYLLLFFAVLFVKNVFAKFSPEWAFLPATVLGFYVFRSRIKTLGRFMRSVYLDKRERLNGFLKRPVVMAPVAVAVLFLLFAPIWRDNVDALFVLEPAARATLRASVPGQVVAVNATEGSQIRKGQLLVQLENLDLTGRSARAEADFRVATLKVASAQVGRGQLGPEEQLLRAAFETKRGMYEQIANLQLRSPIDGVLVTPRLEDRVGSYVTAGTELAEVVDTSHLQVRIYIPDHEIGKVRIGRPVRMFVYAHGSVQGVLEWVASDSQAIPAGLSHQVAFRGIREARFYAAGVSLAGDTGLHEGMSGTAKILVTRRSSVGIVWNVVREFSGRKLW